MAALDKGLTAIMGTRKRRLGLDQGVSRVPTYRAGSRRPKSTTRPDFSCEIFGLGPCRGVFQAGFSPWWTKRYKRKNMEVGVRVILIGGLRGPIPGFPSRGRKRGTCTRGAGVGSRAGGSGPLAAGQAAVAVAPGRGHGGLSQEGRWGGDWPTEVRGRRRAAAIRKNVWRHARGRLLLPCPYSKPLDLRLGLLPGRRSRLGAWAWAQRGGGSPRRGRWRWRRGGSGGPRAGATAGHQG